MAKSIWTVVAELYPRVIEVLPDHFVGTRLYTDDICIRDGAGVTITLYTRAEIDDNLSGIPDDRPGSLVERLQSIKRDGRF